MTTVNTSRGVPAAAAGDITLGGDLTVNRMGFGAMRLTGKGIWGPPNNPEQAVCVLQRAVDLGVNFFDTAYSYGPLVAEQVIADALYPYPGSVIATKGGLERPGPDKWVENGKPEFLRQNLEDSLKRLRIKQIDLWQLHRIDPKIPAEEQFAAVAEFQREGLIRHVGLSEVKVADIERARKFFPVVSVQNLYNITDRKWEDEVQYCERESLAFIPWFPLSAGALDDPTLHEVAARHGSTVFQIALAWLLEHSPAMLVIPGTSSVEHLEENVAAAEIRLSKKDMKALDALR